MPSLANKIFLTIFLVFTNCKAFLFALIIYPIYDFLIVFLQTIKNKLIEKKIVLVGFICAIVGLIGYYALYFGTQNIDYNIFLLLMKPLKGYLFLVIGQ